MLSNGSRGDDVRKLQQTLVDAGYDVGSAGVDGIYGAGTEAAVRKYQKDNGLDVDGIAGDQTLGTLYGGNGNNSNSNKNNTTSNKVANKTAANTKFKYDAYQQSDAVTQAEALLQQQMASRPGAYESKWQQNIDEILGQIQNREEFSYDLNGDALYNQYKDQYVQQGQMAMMNTMGQAAALTGGYGNSYAQSVGQQAYQGYLQQLNDVVPELYQLALNQYNLEGDELYRQLALYGDQENQDYSRYRDQISDYNAELDRLYQQYLNERDFDYGKYADDRDFAYGKYADDRAYQYQAERDAIADEQWQKKFEEAQRQYNQTYALQAGKVGSSGGGSSGGSSGGSGKSSGGSKKSGGSSSGGSSTKSNPGLSTSEIRSIQQQAGITVDGIWGPQTADAYYNKGYRPKSGGGASSAYSSIAAQCITYKRNGASPSKISSYLRSAYNAGQITQAEYNALKEKYGGNPNRSEAK